jgi:hypothetical protein
LKCSERSKEKAQVTHAGTFSTPFDLNTPHTPRQTWGDEETMTKEQFHFLNFAVFTAATADADEVRKCGQ